MRFMLAILALVPALASAQFTSFVSFGDSLSDTGNVTVLTGGALPPAGYAPGRYSNGVLWNEVLAARFGLTVTPSLLGGKNFAFGSAETGPGLASTSSVPTLLAQAGQATAAGTVFDAGTLVTLWCGGNDIFNGLDATAAADRVSGLANDLVAAGAGKIVIANLVDAGKLPEYRGTANEVPFSLAAATYNTRLAANLAAISSPRVVLVDVNALFTAVSASPATFGFTDVTTPGMSAGPGGENHLFWDTFHPTTKAHQIIGNQAYDAVVPEPASMAVLGLGLAAMRRRRSQC